MHINETKWHDVRKYSLDSLYSPRNLHSTEPTSTFLLSRATRVASLSIFTFHTKILNISGTQLFHFISKQCVTFGGIEQQGLYRGYQKLSRRIIGPLPSIWVRAKNVLVWQTQADRELPVFKCPFIDFTQNLFYDMLPKIWSSFSFVRHGKLRLEEAK